MLLGNVGMANTGVDDVTMGNGVAKPAKVLLTLDADQSSVADVDESLIWRCMTPLPI